MMCEWGTWSIWGACGPAGVNFRQGIPRGSWTGPPIESLIWLFGSMLLRYILFWALAVLPATYHHSVVSSKWGKKEMDLIGTAGKARCSFTWSHFPPWEKPWAEMGSLGTKLGERLWGKSQTLLLTSSIAYNSMLKLLHWNTGLLTKAVSSEGTHVTKYFPEHLSGQRGPEPLHKPLRIHSWDCTMGETPPRSLGV